MPIYKMRTMFPKCRYYMPRHRYIIYALLGIVALATIRYLATDSRKSVDVFVVEEHHEALRYWHHLTVVGGMNRTGNTLVHIDAHSDMAPPDFIEGFPFFKFPLNEAEMFTMMQKNDVFIQGAAIIGMLDHMIWIYPSWDKSEFGEYTAFLFEIGYMTRVIEGEKRVIFCECHTPVDRHTHHVVDNGPSDCSYLDESQANIEDAEVSVKKEQCHVKKSILYEVIVDELALEVLQKSAWVTKPTNVILDIDEDFFGCERGGTPLEKTKIRWTLVERLDELISSMICPKNPLYEDEGDVLMKDLILNYLHICELKKSSFCTAKQETVLTRIMTPILEKLHEKPRLFCKSEHFIQQILLNMITALSRLTYEQVVAVARLGFCMNTSPATYGFDQGRAEFTICHGANTPNETLVVIYQPDEQEVTRRTTMLQSTLEHLIALKPNVVTVCRSIRDGYTPRHLTTQIEAGIIDFFKKSHRDMKFNMIYDSNLLGGEEGWDGRYRPQI